MPTSLLATITRYYGVALSATAVVFAVVFWRAGVSALWPVFVLAVIEITFSFDNAVLNSEVLGRMSKVWRTIFLTVGIAIAVFGVRLLFPLVLVSVTAARSMGDVLQMALHQPETYSELLHHSYPVIAAFGGSFLLMIGLRFLAEERDIHWLPIIERTISRPKRPFLIPVAGALIVTVIIGTVLRPGDRSVVIASLLGILTFLAVKGLSVFLESRQSRAGGSGSNNWVNFLYLELLDASFSFDGVIAAFAITKEVLLIAAGLGIGALYVRSLTVHLLERNTLAQYRYLVHGAHYAIAALGIVMCATIRFELPEWLTGLIGLVIIGFALRSSRRAPQA